MIYRSNEPDYRERLRRNAAARHAHEVHRAYRAALGEEPGSSWEDLPGALYPACLGAIEALLGPDGDEGGEARHRAWLRLSGAEGWRYGEREDRARRLSPCMRPWESLAPEQRAKDALWLAAVRGMLAELREREEPEVVEVPVDEDALDGEAADIAITEQGSDPPVSAVSVAARLEFVPALAAPMAPAQPSRAERRRLRGAR